MGVRKPMVPIVTVISGSFDLFQIRVRIAELRPDGPPGCPSKIGCPATRAQKFLPCVPGCCRNPSLFATRQHRCKTCCCCATTVFFSQLNRVCLLGLCPCLANSGICESNCLPLEAQPKRQDLTYWSVGKVLAFGQVGCF